MSGLCREPLLIGETGGVRSWEPCGRALHSATGMCVHHAREAGLIARSVLSLELRKKMADGKRKRRKSSGDPAAAAEKKAQASATFAEVRRLRKEVTERRQMREAAVDKRMNKPRGVRPSD